MTKYLLFFPLAAILFAGEAQARRGTEGVGGGDECENRIQEISFDLKRWIQGGGSSDLELPAGIALDHYNHRMQAAIGAATIRCVGPGEPGYPVMVQKASKVCRFDLRGADAVITCDREKFKAMTEEEQYVLTHHEYAGIAQIEKPSGERSSYILSNQISAYLEAKLVKKLAVKPKNQRRGAFTCQADIEKFIAKKFPKKTWSDGTSSRLIGVRIVESEYQGEMTGEVEIEAYAKFDLYYDEDGRAAERIFLIAEGVSEGSGDDFKITGCRNFKVRASYEKWLAEEESAR